jgi:hypothetical protein
MRLLKACLVSVLENHPDAAQEIAKIRAALIKKGSL